MNVAIFFVVIFLLSAWCVFVFGRVNRKNKIVGKDINKLDQRILPEAAGVGMLIPLWVAVLSVIYFYSQKFNPFYFLFGLTVSGFCFMGLLDDTKHKFMVKTTPWLYRAVPIAFLALLFGVINFYSLGPVWVVLIALFVAGLASLQNTFAGLNGWEIGSGFIISCFVTLIISQGIDPYLLLLALALNAMILGLLFWNRYPARVFPGDSGTLFIGSAIAALLVMNQKLDMIVLGFLFFLPHLADFFLLKLLTNPKDVSQSKSMPYEVLSDGKLYIPKTGDGRKLDFAKLLMKVFGPMREWQVVLVIWIVVALNGLFWAKVFGVI